MGVLVWVNKLAWKWIQHINPYSVEHSTLAGCENLDHAKYIFLAGVSFLSGL
jgi:hypothetical protein